MGFLAAAGALRAPNRKYRIIDPHVHVWKADPKYPWAKETTRPPEKDATPEMLLELMKQAGVEKTVIIQVIHYRWDNRYAADTLRKYRDMSSPNHSYIYGDFEICPTQADTPGQMRRVCVAGAKNLVVENLSGLQPPFRILSTWKNTRR